jgi:hypothetical protein
MNQQKETDTMKIAKYTKFHAGTNNPRTLHRGTAPKPNPYHGGSGKQKGVLHAPPAPGGAVNSANYGGRK